MWLCSFPNPICWNFRIVLNISYNRDICLFKNKKKRWKSVYFLRTLLNWGLYLDRVLKHVKPLINWIFSSFMQSLSLLQFIHTVTLEMLKYWIYFLLVVSGHLTHFLKLNYIFFLSKPRNLKLIIEWQIINNAVSFIE